MKKPYISPTIEMENFTLNQQIASCGAIKISLTDMDCVLNDPDATPEMERLAMAGFFLDGCFMTPIGTDSDDGICYFTNVNAAFTS